MEKSEGQQDEVMTEVECTSALEDFASTGRTGRRNAVPDIQNDPNTAVGATDVTFEMDKLKCEDGSQPQASTSGASPQASASSSTEGATAS
ncbi:cAMP-dependent protein kinase inhibitor gamma-like [Haliotis rubra]|uniref:cAMP-dependent protein kinase inhibitor gamma-like n=1 Tax=Haliotis rubra TaxID=36100 RepID=UPI001EE510CB|nr:cAMP-dependent protein kinase inhibitor gamma-like [Haliotis rubra]